MRGKLQQGPAEKRIDILFFLGGQRSRPIGARFDSPLRPATEIPILFAGELPEGEQRLERVVAALFRLAGDEPEYPGLGFRGLLGVKRVVTR